MALCDAPIIAVASNACVLPGLWQMSHSLVPGGDLRAARVRRPISPHARTALPESGGLVISDALIVAAAPVQFAATFYGEYLVPKMSAACYAQQTPKLSENLNESE